LGRQVQEENRVLRKELETSKVEALRQHLAGPALGGGPGTSHLVSWEHAMQASTLSLLQARAALLA
jgi:hypothetical protein